MNPDDQLTRSPLTWFFLLRFWWNFFTYVSDYLKQKKIEIIFDKQFFSETFFHFLRISWNTWSLVASKFGTKLNNFVMYFDIFINFLRIWSPKSTISQKIKNATTEKLFFFHGIQNIAHLFGLKTQFSYFWWSLHSTCR